MKKALFFLMTLVALLPWAVNAQIPQLNEGFEGTTFPPQDWTPIHVSGSSNWQRNTSHHNSDAACAYIAYASSGAENYLVTPKLAPQDGESFSFYIKQTNYSWSGTTITIEVSTTTADAASFTTTLATYQSGSGGDLSTSFDLKNLDLSDYVGQNIFIAIHVTDNNGNNICIDDVSGVSLYVPSCPKPTGLAAVLTPGDGSIATLSWTKGGEETNWVVEYSTASDFTGATQVTSGFITTDDPSISVNLTGLTAETTYYARVKANCGPGDESDWCSTVCPFTPTDAYTITLNDQNTSNNSYIPIYGNYVDYGNRSQFIIPATDLTALQWATLNKLTLYATQTSATFTNDVFSVYLKEVSNPTFASNTFEDWNNLSNVYSGSVSISNNKMEITFSTPYVYQGGNLLVGFYQTAYNSTVSCTWVGVTQTENTALYQTANSSHNWTGTVTLQKFIPEVTIDYTPGVAPSCLPPTALNATEDQPNQSVLSWTANSNENAWTVYYKKTSEENYTSVVANSNPFTLPNLTAATNYIYYVVANCSTEDVSDPSQTKSFTTACPEFLDVPFTENFDSYTLNSTSAPSSRILPICWNYSNESTYSSNKWYPTMNYYSYTDYSNSSPNYLRFYVDAYSNSDHEPTDQYLILPAIQNLSSMRLKLYARANSTSTNYDATFKVGVMEGNNFVQVGNAITPTTTTYEMYTIPFSSYAGDGTHIAIMVEAPETPTASYTYAYRSVFIDDITVEEIPSCLEPTAADLDPY